jgi:hypothetical protein
MAAKTLDDAIEVVRVYALRQFNNAYAQIIALGDSPPANSTTEQKRQHAADLVKAQNEMAAALRQLGQVEDTISENRGRVGYDHLVTLMTTTQQTASDAYDKLKALTGVVSPSAAEQQRITMLTNLLLALARLSPTQIWQKTATPNGTDG